MAWEGLDKLFKFFYSIIDTALDEGFNYERLVWTFNPKHICDPILLPQTWLRKEVLTLMMFSPKLHALVIGPPGIGKTSLADFFWEIEFPYDRAIFAGGETGAVTTAAGLREKIIKLAKMIDREFDSYDPKTCPKAILHLEEFLRAPKWLRETIKVVMDKFKLIISQSQRSDRTGVWPAPILVYADTNPPQQDDWVGPDFQAKKEQLKEFAKESAYIRRFSIVLALDKYDLKQNLIIRKWKEWIMINPHPALESGEFYRKYADFVRKRRKLKVKPTPAPDIVHYFIAGVEELQNRGQLLLNIVYNDYIDNVYAIAEAFARIHGHNEITDEDWKKTLEFLRRVLETIANIERTSKRKLYERVLELGKRKEEEVREIREKIEERFNVK